MKRLTGLASLAGGLVALGGPVRPYPVTTAKDIAEASWAGVGKSLTRAMEEVDRKHSTSTTTRRTKP